MGIIIDDKGRSFKEVGDLRYGDTFRYANNFYMRVGTHAIKGILERANHISTGTKSLNTESSVLIIRLTTGALLYKRRELFVEPVNLHCAVEKIEEED